MKASLLALLSVLSVATLSAQTAAPAQPSAANAEDEPTRDGLWDGRLKGGSYVVRANAIMALSKHEYIADATARVVEVNVSLNTSMVVRFYFLEPVRVEGGGMIGAAQSALDKARGVVEQTAGRISPTLTEPKAVKNYPMSTHAHTIEFWVKDEERLNSLYGSLNRAFRTGQGRIWKE
ncbi:MAG: hypothetical protein U0984_02760 [Prosthecobacter sp.]|nr:hypothetical protein [Prosthecobacter sp.]